MARTLEMFDKPRKKREWLMHVCDCGTGNADGLTGTQELVKYRCNKCGHETDWIVMPNVTAAKRGIPCVACNA